MRRGEVDDALARILARALVNAVRDEDKSDAAVGKAGEQDPVRQPEDDASDDAPTSPLAA
jgi:hypothetical protein